MPSEAALQDHLLEKRKAASIAALGTSSCKDLRLICSLIEDQDFAPDAKVLDVGCGTGELLELMQAMHSEWKLTGMDLEKFEGPIHNFEFVEHDLNRNFPSFEKKFDLIIASHVILYLENPRHFVRQLSQCLRPGGCVIINNPNTDGLRNVVSMALRGRPFCFSPLYPGHIAAPSVFEMRQILSDAGLALEEVRYTGQGRIPGLSLDWQSFLPFARGKRFSDAYSLFAVKVSE